MTEQKPTEDKPQTPTPPVDGSEPAEAALKSDDATVGLPPPPEDLGADEIPRRERRRRLALLLGLLVLLPLLAGLGWLAQALLQLQPQLAQLDQQDRQWQQQLEALQRQNSAQAEQLGALKAQWSAQQGQLAPLAGLAGLEQEWQQFRSEQEQRWQRLTQQLAEPKEVAPLQGELLAEALYLVKLAQHRLLLLQDRDTALLLLQEVDDRLASLTRLDTYAARQALAEDMAELRSLPNLDTTAVRLQLDALIKQLPKLPLATQQPSGQTLKFAEPSRTAEGEPRWYQRLGDKLTATLGSLYRVRKLDGPVQPLMAPDQQQLLQWNLTLALQESALAAARGETEPYRAALDRARQWLLAYYQTQDPAVQALSQQLQVLSEKAVRWPVLNILASRNAIEQLAEAEQNASRPSPEPAP